MGTLQFLAEVPEAVEAVEEEGDQAADRAAEEAVDRMMRLVDVRAAAAALEQSVPMRLRRRASVGRL